MPAYETSSEQFGLVAGARHDRSELLLCFEPRVRASAATEARKGWLYLALDTSQHPTAECRECQLIARTIRKTFYEDQSFSVTSSLRKAVLAANTALYQHNFNLPPSQRAHIGITCAVVREHGLFVAQVAPAQAYVLSEGRVRALPVHPSWHTAHTSATPFVDPSALGASLYIDPEMYRCTLQPEDALIICSSNLAHLLQPANVHAMFDAPEPAAALDYLHGICTQHAITDANAMLVRLQPAPEPTRRAAPGQRLSALQPGANLLDRLAASLGGAQGEAWLTTLRRTLRPAPNSDKPAAAPGTPPASAAANDAAQDERIYQPQHEEPMLLPPFPPKTLPIDVGMSPQEQHEHAQIPDTAKLPPSAFLGEHDYFGRSSHPQHAIDLSDTLAFSARARPYRTRFERRPLVDMSLGERLALPFRWLNATMHEFSNRRSPRHRRPPPAPSKKLHSYAVRDSFTEQPETRRFPTLLLLIIVLAVALLLLYGIILSRQDANQRTMAYLHEAEQRMAAVYQAPDQQEAQERLTDAEQALDEVRASPLITVTNAAFWLRYQDLQGEYQRAQSSIYRISFVDDIEVLAEHPVPSGRFASVVVPAASASITDTFALEALNYIYALDGNSEFARLYRIPRDGGMPETFLSPNDQVRDTEVGPLRGIAWRYDNIVAIDQGNNGFGYYLRDAGAWNYIRLGGSEIWTPRGRIDLEAYLGNLYVWGAEPNEILRYSSGRYGDIPTLWLDPDQLAGRDVGSSIDMAVDGNIYLLQPDGSVLVLAGGGVTGEIVPETIHPPLTSVTRFFVTGTMQDGWIFLLDTLNERVIQMDKASGRVVQQIRLHPDSSQRLNQLTDLYIDTGPNRSMLYLVNGGEIVRTTLPSPPAPFTPADDAEQPASRLITAPTPAQTETVPAP